MTASDNRFEKYFLPTPQSFPWFEITCSVVTLSTTVLSFTLIYLSYPVGILAFSSPGAKSALYVLNLGKLLHHLASADVFLASAL